MEEEKLGAKLLAAAMESNCNKLVEKIKSHSVTDAQKGNLATLIGIEDFFETESLLIFSELDQSLVFEIRDRLAKEGLEVVFLRKLRHVRIFVSWAYWMESLFYKQHTCDDVTIPNLCKINDERAYKSKFMDRLMSNPVTTEGKE